MALNHGRVEPAALVADAPVKMWPCGPARHAHLSDHLASGEQRYPVRCEPQVYRLVHTDDRSGWCNPGKRQSETRRISIAYLLSCSFPA